MVLKDDACWLEGSRDKNASRNCWAALEFSNESVPSVTWWIDVKSGSCNDINSFKLFHLCWCVRTWYNDELL
ncbi:hypothetical protein POPTR_013G078001v4 [Populus trichocarpa]|uniref:Uncharacterized protein n=1 Tax=Populus trichocarpa TaxID=3694 RepID=A0ACC0S2K3_POPTR|nr:hypothetical protein POPTR_013G078001v4 [Populus trichocarpa]